MIGGCRKQQAILWIYARPVQRVPAGVTQLLGGHKGAISPLADNYRLRWQWDWGKCIKFTSADKKTCSGVALKIKAQNIHRKDIL